jgi:hypothetical protein
MGREPAAWQEQQWASYLSSPLTTHDTRVTGDKYTNGDVLRMQSASDRTCLRLHQISFPVKCADRGAKHALRVMVLLGLGLSKALGR